MKLLTKALTEKLVKNHEKLHEPGFDPKPVVKLFNPCGAATWLISSMDPETMVMFGLCDLGMGFPELGDVSYYELANYSGPLGIGIERDLYWEADKSLSEYAKEARMKGAIAA